MYSTVLVAPIVLVLKPEGKVLVPLKYKLASLAKVKTLAPEMAKPPLSKPPPLSLATVRGTDELKTLALLLVISPVLMMLTPPVAVNVGNHSGPAAKGEVLMYSNLAADQ